MTSGSRRWRAHSVFVCSTGVGPPFPPNQFGAGRGNYDNFRGHLGGGGVPKPRNSRWGNQLAVLDSSRHCCLTMCVSVSLLPPPLSPSSPPPSGACGGTLAPSLSTETWTLLMTWTSFKLLDFVSSYVSHNPFHLFLSSWTNISLTLKLWLLVCFLLFCVAMVTILPHQ